MKSWMIAVAVLLLGAGSARADMSWQIRTETTVKVGAETRALPDSTTSFALKNNVLRIDNGADQPAEVINLSNGTVVFISYDTSTFLLTDLEGLISTGANEREALRAKLPLMELQINNFPPEERPVQKALLDSQRRKYELWSRPYSVRATDVKETIDGRPCRKFEGLAGEEVFQDIWVAEGLVPDRYYQTQVVQRLAAIDPQQYQVLARTPGLPVKVVSRYGAVTVTTTMLNYSTSPVAPDAFIIPDQFRETEAASKRNH